VQHAHARQVSPTTPPEVDALASRSAIDRSMATVDRSAYGALASSDQLSAARVGMAGIAACPEGGT
jgi:hypothetical protein